jgi:hypothetical protein
VRVVPLNEHPVDPAELTRYLRTPVPEPPIAEAVRLDLTSISALLLKLTADWLIFVVAIDSWVELAAL